MKKPAIKYVSFEASATLSALQPLMIANSFWGRRIRMQKDIRMYCRYIEHLFIESCNISMADDAPATHKLSLSHATGMLNEFLLSEVV